MRALITGGARRLGAAIATALTEAGVRVVIHTGSSVEQAAALAQELGGDVLQGELRTVEGCRGIVTEYIDRFGEIDILVNNAAAYEAAPLLSIQADQWDAMFHVNARAPFLLSQGLVPLLRQSPLLGGGLILNLIDIAGERPAPGFAHYCASKAALHMLTRALAVELAPAVRVNGISPGTVLPPEGLSAGALAAIQATIPAERFGEPDDIARLARFLALEAPYVTGQIWSVDGGRSVAGALTVG